MNENGLIADAERIADHWWSRPGWHPGRLTDTWHLTFEQMEPVRDLASACDAALVDLPHLSMVPTAWLHMTMQSVGWTDEISADEIRQVTIAVRERLDTIRAFEVILGPPTVKGEALVLPAQPTDQLAELRAHLREGIATGLGRPALVATEQRDGFKPHVSVAYASVNADAAPYRAALASVSPATASARIESVALIRQERRLAPDRLYRWDELDRVPLICR